MVIYQCNNCMVECEIRAKNSNPPILKHCLFFNRKSNWKVKEKDKVDCFLCEFYEPDIKKCPESVEKWCKLNNYKSYVKRGTLHVQSSYKVSAQKHR